MSYKNGGFNKSERKIYKLKSDNYRLKVLLADVFPIIDNALNYFYPLRAEDGDKAMDARARLFELRDKIKTQIKQEGINDQPNS